MLGDVEQQSETALILLVLFVVLLISYFSFIFAARILSKLGETGINVISRVLGILLAALAVQFMLDGIRASMIQG
jgi:multiple antibiotic resistance protein